MPGASSDPIDFLELETPTGVVRLEYSLCAGRGPDEPTAVFLHEGLGSIASWTDFPQQLRALTGCASLSYSRAGYGRSQPPIRARREDYMHVEALDVLPALLDALGIGRPVLIGHSDGASIALLHAGASSRPVAALVAIAPHVFVEEVSLAGIEAAVRAYEQGTLRDALVRLHDDPEGCFRAWADTWLSPSFRGWSIEGVVAGIECPLLLVQGARDEYGTLEQLDRIEAGVRGAHRDARVQRLVLPGVRHHPHREATGPLLHCIGEFVMSSDGDKRRA